MILFNILNFYLLFDSFYSREIVSKHTIWLLKLNFLNSGQVHQPTRFCILLSVEYNSAKLFWYELWYEVQGKCAHNFSAVSLSGGNGTLHIMIKLALSQSPR